MLSPQSSSHVYQDLLSSTSPPPLPPPPTPLHPPDLSLGLEPWGGGVSISSPRVDPTAQGLLTFRVRIFVVYLLWVVNSYAMLTLMPLPIQTESFDQTDKMVKCGRA